MQPLYQVRQARDQDKNDAAEPDRDPADGLGGSEKLSDIAQLFQDQFLT